MKLIVVAGVCAVALIAGCGGGDSDEGAAPSSKTTEKRISKAEYIQRGDDLCREFRKTSDPVERQIRETSDPSEQAGLLRRVADAFDRALKGFDALPKPRGDEDVLTRYLDTARENVVLVRRAADDLDEGKADEATSLLQNAVDASNKAEGIAQGYGFKVCGSD